MFKYMDKIKQLLDLVEKEEKKSIKEAIDVLTQAKGLQKRSVYIFGASHAGILAEEMYYRAGGMMTINAIFGREVMLDRSPITFTSQMERLEGYGTDSKTVSFKNQDVLILHSVSGRNPIIIDLALAAKAKGVKIISLTNVQYSRSVTSRHSSGKRLFEVSDIVIDNHGDIGDACCELTGIVQKAGPSSTVIGAAILNTIIVEVCEQLIANGIKHPPIFYSANLAIGGRYTETRNYMRNIKK